MIDETIELAQKEVGALLDLLDDPHPGLSTWVRFVDWRVKRVAWLFGYYEALPKDQQPHL